MTSGKTREKVIKSDMAIFDNPLNINFNSCGLFTSEEKWIHPRRQIDSYEVMYVVAGTVYLEEDANRYILESGSVFILSPDKTHGGYEYSTGKTSFYWAHFNLPDGQSLSDTLELMPGCIQLNDGYRLSSFFKQLLHIASTRGYPQYAVNGALLILVGELVLAQNSSEMQTNRLVSDVAEWIRINSNKKLTVSNVADHFGYNSDYLCSLIRRTFLVSLKQYIYEERMKHIKNLLITTEYTMKQIAYILEWVNENQFLKYFKYHEGISPAKYRNIFFSTHWNNH
jgi:AraC-like DNA-binding protein